MVKYTQKNLLKMCYSKITHNTLDEAYYVAKATMAYRGAPQLYIYYCPNCNKFHLTHKVTKHRVI